MHGRGVAPCPHRALSTGLGSGDAAVQRLEKAGRKRGRNRRIRRAPPCFASHSASLHVRTSHSQVRGLQSSKQRACRRRPRSCACTHARTRWAHRARNVRRARHALRVDPVVEEQLNLSVLKGPGGQAGEMLSIRSKRTEIPPPRRVYKRTVPKREFFRVRLEQEVRILGVAEVGRSLDFKVTLGRNGQPSCLARVAHLRVLGRGNGRVGQPTSRGPSRLTA